MEGVTHTVNTVVKNAIYVLRDIRKLSMRNKSTDLIDWLFFNCIFKRNLTNFAEFKRSMKT